jgi:hypothetical protein
MEEPMEEIEIMSWITLDALKKAAKIEETVGDLQKGHCMSIFGKIEEDYLELCYSDTGPNYLRRYEDKDELLLAIEKRKEEVGETPYDEDRGFENNFPDEDLEDEFGPDGDDSEKF